MHAILAGTLPEPPQQKNGTLPALLFYGYEKFEKWGPRLTL